jgi:hypothetical protein
MKTRDFHEFLAFILRGPYNSAFCKKIDTFNSFFYICMN